MTFVGEINLQRVTVGQSGGAGRSVGQITTSMALLGVTECPIGMTCTLVSQLSTMLVGQQGLVLPEVALLLPLYTRRVAGLVGPPLHTLGSTLLGNS